MLKATREAKVSTSWANPNDAYESRRALRARAPRGRGATRSSRTSRRVQPVAWSGYLNGSRWRVKLASPGVPDIYQGNETWDFSLVDPDNRRPVDYARREAMLAELEALEAPLERRSPRCSRASRTGGRTLRAVRMLRLRRERERSSAPAATARSARRASWGGISSPSRAATNARARSPWRRGWWPPSDSAARAAVRRGVGATRLDLGFLKDGTELRDVFTLRTHVIAGGGLDVAAVLAHFPVAVLVA
jgi:(1->4)-alpha-D-glucan 1-alpha-D-glucosylmutase